MSFLFAANISLLFADLPFPERIAAARQAGFDGVEMQYPYAFDARDLAGKARENHIQTVLINAPAGDRERGERGLAADPRRRQDFRDSVHQALAYAESMNCRQIHVLSGKAPHGRETGFACAAENLAWAAEQADGHGVRILVEAMNSTDVPGYLLKTNSDSAQLVEVARQISRAPHALGVLFDTYHCQMGETDIVTALTEAFPLVSHIQIADVPGRNEPGSGEIDWSGFRRTLTNLGFEGWIGCEYHPRLGTVEGLGWRSDWAEQQPLAAGDRS